MSWLINSMTKKIREDFMYYKMTKRIWDAGKETYSDNDNAFGLFEVKRYPKRSPLKKTYSIL